MRAVSTFFVAAAMLLGACAQEQAPQSELSLGLAAFKEGRLGQAEQHFNNMLAKDPNEPYANLNIGAVKALTGRREEAIGHYQLAAANGEGVPILSLVRPSTDAENTKSTVADVARRNLANL